MLEKSPLGKYKNKLLYSFFILAFLFFLPNQSTAVRSGPSCSQYITSGNACTFARGAGDVYGNAQVGLYCTGPLTVCVPEFVCSTYHDCEADGSCLPGCPIEECVQCGCASVSCGTATCGNNQLDASECCDPTAPGTPPGTCDDSCYCIGGGGSSCDDGVCDPGEDQFSCPQDCATCTNPITVTPAGSATITVNQGNSVGFSYKINSQSAQVVTVTFSGVTGATYGGQQGNQNVAAGDTYLSGSINTAGVAQGTYTLTVGAVSASDSDCTGITTFTVQVTAPAPACDINAVGSNRLVGCVYNGNNFNTLHSQAPSGTQGSGITDTFTALPDPGWGTGGPTGLSDNFSVRWKGNFSFTGGNYRFSVGNLDDGARLIIDGSTVWQAWPANPCCQTHTVDVNLSSGSHAIWLEYREDGGGAGVSLYWQLLGQADNSQCISFTGPSTAFTSQSITSTVVFKNTGSATWTSGPYAFTYPEAPPAYPSGGAFAGGPQQLAVNPASIAPNANSTFTFSVTAPSTPGTYVLKTQMLHNGVAWFGEVCSKTITVSAPVYSYIVTPSSLPFSATQNGSTPGNQNFTITNTGNQPLTIGVNEAISWAGISTSSVTIPVGDTGTVTVNINTTALSPATYSGNINFTHAQAGNVSKSVDYTVNPPAATCDATPGTNTMKGCVYSGTNFNTYVGATTGNPTASGNADTFTALPQYDVVANSGGRTAGQTTNFSARWQGTFTFTAGNYIFTAGSDDGKRVYVDNVLVIDDWVPQGYSGSIKNYTFNGLTAGSHTIKMEFYQGAGGAEYSLSWAKQAAVCPAGSVSLGSSSITTGNTTTASASAGFTGGTFVSSNTGVATVSGGTVTGVSAGSSNISGSNWTYSSTGATNCSLSAAALTVSAAAVNQAPVANATISKDGSTYSDLITVTQGVATPIYLAAGSAAGTSSDPDGWTHASFGMSGGGAKCDWNRDLNQGAATFESPAVSNPATAAGCNISLGNLTFNDAPGTYTYNVLRLTDRAGGVSSVDTVQVQVNPPAATYSYTVTPASLPFTATQNSSLPGSQNFTITNTGNQSLTIGVNEAISWAGISTGSVTVAAGATATVTVSINTTALSPSAYSGNVNFTHAQAGNLSRPVNYTVNPPAATCDTSPGTNYMKGCLYDGTNFDTPTNTSVNEAALTAPVPLSASPVPYKAWGDPGGPDSSNPDTFSIRWKGTFDFPAGNYVFTIGGDDGVRAYFDDNNDGIPNGGANVYLVNDWSLHGYRTLASASTAVTGVHTLVLEFFENGGDATYSLSWVGTAAAVNQAPVANATISKDGSTYSDLITVTQGVATPIYLAAGSAAGTSSDPDGWTHASFGMSGGGAKCDWNRDLNQGAATFESPAVSNPATAAGCNISLGNLTFNDAPGTYTYNVLRLTDRAGGVSSVDTVQVQVNAQVITDPGGGANDPCVENGTNICGSSAPNQGSGSVTCQQVRISWSDNSNNEQGFYVYRDTDSNPASGATRIDGGTLGTGATTFLYTPPDNNPYYYFISAYNAGGESNRIAADNNSVASVNCEANLGSSDKDIIGVNSQSWTNGDCDGYQGAPSSMNVVYRSGDIITYEISMCNNTGTEDAIVEQIIDTMSNLDKPAAGWDARYQQQNNPNVWNPINPAESGSFPNITLTFNMPGSYSVAVGAVRKLVFEAQVKLPSTSGDFARFFNSASIRYRKDAGSPVLTPKTVITPAVLFFQGTLFPERGEIP